MKKRIFPLVVVGTLLVGCGSSSATTYSSEVSKGSDNIVTIGDTTVSNNEVYHYLLEQYGSSQVLAMALTYIADQEITDKDAIQAKLDEKVTSYSANLSTSLEEYAKSLGYDSQQAYIDDVLTIGVKQEMLQNKYIDKKYDSLVKEYKVKYLKIITVDTESGALNLIDQIKAGANFDTLSSENSGTDAGMITTESTTVDSNIIKKLDKFTKDGLHSTAIKTSDSKYAVVYVYNTDKSNLKDEIKTNLASISDMASKMEAYYLRKYNFEVNEKAIKDEIEKTNKDYLG